MTKNILLSLFILIVLFLYSDCKCNQFPIQVTWRYRKGKKRKEIKIKCKFLSRILHTHTQRHTGAHLHVNKHITSFLTITYSSTVWRHYILLLYLQTIRSLLVSYNHKQYWPNHPFINIFLHFLIISLQ